KRTREFTEIAVGLGALGEIDRARITLSLAGASAITLPESQKANLSNQIEASLGDIEVIAEAAALPVERTPVLAVERRDEPLMRRRIRLFVASPSDVILEREELRKVVAELNRSFAPNNGIILEVFGWETHVAAAMGRPQAIINEQIDDFEIFIGIM